jgi:hypothetical protein
VHALNAYWYRKADLDGPLFVRSDSVLAGAVAGGEALTRAELGTRLADAGVVAQGPRLAYILMHAELEELVCSGPRRGRQHTYAHFDERVPTTVSDDRPYDTAIEDLLWRYLQSHGPATVKDFATWSSLPVRDSRAAVQRLEERIDSWADPDGTVWHSARQVAPVGIRQERLDGAFLLPMYDEMIVAHQDLRVALDAPLPRTDFLERVVVIHGVTVGTWKRTLGARSAVVDVSLLRKLTPVEGRALEAVVGRFERFLGVDTTLRSSVVR